MRESGLETDLRAFHKLRFVKRGRDLFFSGERHGWQGQVNGNQWLIVVEWLIHLDWGSSLSRACRLTLPSRWSSGQPHPWVLRPASYSWQSSGCPSLRAPCWMASLSSFPADPGNLTQRRQTNPPVVSLELDSWWPRPCQEGPCFYKAHFWDAVLMLGFVGGAG